MVDVKICTGTTCYVLGASELLLLEENLPEETLRRVSISGLSCMDLCGRRAAARDELRPPFALVDGEIHGGLTLAELARIVTKRVEEGARAGTEE